MEKESKSKNVKKSIIFLILSIATFICYINTIHNPFLWDDEVTVVNNPLIRNLEFYPEIFKTTLFGEKLQNGKYYRPIQILSYAIDYKLWKLNPIGYHISNILLHLLNVFLVFLILLEIGLGKNISFLISLIFAIHPINTESVTYISGRGDVLFLFFSLFSFLFFIRGLNNKKIYYLLSVLSYLIALLSKENAIVMPFIILAYVFLIPKEKKTKNFIFPLFLLFAITIGYIGLRLLYLNSSQTKALSLISEATIRKRILTLPRILITYIKLLIFPYHLHMEYLFVENSLTSPYILLGIPFLISFFYLSLRYIKPFNYSFFFLLWFLIGLSPFYNIILPLHATLLEHWAYLPAIGFIALIVLGIHQLFLKIRSPVFKNIILISSVLMMIYYTTSTINRNGDWSNPIRLYKHDLKYEPKSFLLHNNLGVEYFRRGIMDKAKEEFLKSIEVAPGNGYDVAHNNIGVIYENEGKIKEAILNYKKSISINNYQLAYSNLGRIYLKLGLLDNSIKILEKGLNLYPLDAEINYYLGIAYFSKKEFTKSYKTFKNLEKIYPGYKDVRIYLNKLRLVPK